MVLKTNAKIQMLKFKCEKGKLIGNMLFFKKGKKEKIFLFYINSIHM